MPTYPRYPKYRSRHESLSREQARLAGSTKIDRFPHHRRFHQYQPLEPFGREIRLLELVRSDDFYAPLRAHLRVFSLENDTDLDYVSLSYMWGDPTPIDYVCIEGHVDGIIPIARNLSWALRHLRREGIGQMWIDALSINQSDLEERAGQVSMMYQIYEHAKFVLVWLSVPADHMELAKLAMDEFVREGRDYSKNVKSWLEDNSLHHEPNLVVAMLLNAYWKRIWIQQEVDRAKACFVYSEVCDTSLDNLKRLYDILWIKAKYPYDYQYPLTTLLDALPLSSLDSSQNRRWELNRLELSRVARYESSLLYLATESRSLACVDNRDRVYASLHRASDYTQGELQVDYSKSEKEVLDDVVAHYLGKHQKLDFLRNVAVDPDEPSSDTEVLMLPSWMPSWSRRTALPPWAFFRDCFADGNIKSALHQSQQLNKLHLRCQGIPIERLDAVDRCASTSSNEATFADVWNILLNVVSRESFSGKDPIKATARALFQVANTMQPPRPPTRGIECWERLAWSVDVLNKLAEDPTTAQLAIATFHRDWFLRPPDKAIVSLCELIIKTVIISAKHWFGIMPRCSAQTGDEIWILFGCAIPVVLRPVDDHYLFVGPIAVAGLMKGEAAHGVDPYAPVLDGTTCGNEGQFTVRTIEIH